MDTCVLSRPLLDEIVACLAEVSRFAGTHKANDEKLPAAPVLVWEGNAVCEICLLDKNLGDVLYSLQCWYVTLRTRAPGPEKTRSHPRTRRPYSGSKPHLACLEKLLASNSCQPKCTRCLKRFTREEIRLVVMLARKDRVLGLSGPAGQAWLAAHMAKRHQLQDAATTSSANDASVSPAKKKLKVKQAIMHKLRLPVASLDEKVVQVKNKSDDKTPPRLVPYFVLDHETGDDECTLVPMFEDGVFRRGPHRGRKRFRVKADAEAFDHDARDVTALPNAILVNKHECLLDKLTWDLGIEAFPLRSKAKRRNKAKRRPRGRPPRSDAGRWKTDHEWVGRFVARYYQGKVFRARVTKWDPKKPPIWHVVHEDGDEEDLDRDEVLAAMDVHQRIFADESDGGARLSVKRAKPTVRTKTDVQVVNADRRNVSIATSSGATTPSGTTGTSVSTSGRTSVRTSGCMSVSAPVPCKTNNLPVSHQETGASAACSKTKVSSVPTESTTTETNNETVRGTTTTTPRIRIGQDALRASNDGTLLKVRVLKVGRVGDTPSCLVHYTGWPPVFDQWVASGSIITHIASGVVLG